MPRYDPAAAKADGIGELGRIAKHLADAPSLTPGSSLDNVVQPTSPASVPFVVKAAAGQTADLLQFQDSAGATLGSVDALGNWRSGPITFLDPSNGTGDATAINAALTGGGVVATRPGQTYIVDAPLVIPSNTTLWVTAGSTLQRKTGVYGNLIRNSAVTALRSTSDAATTSASATVTSATAAFTSADVGRSVSIAAAGGGSNVLYTTVASVTNATTAVLSLAASATLTGAAMSIFGRDSNIGLVCDEGAWINCANNQGNPPLDVHHIVFRRVDGLTVRISKLTTTGAVGKYALYPGDVTDFDISVRGLSTASDGVHVRGPASNGRIHGITGTTGDDFVILGCGDSSTNGNDIMGDITDVEVRDLRATSLGSFSTFKVYGFTGTKARRITVRGVKGTGLGTLSIGATGANASPLDIDQLLIEDVESDLAGTATINLLAETGGTVQIRNVSPYGSGGIAVAVAQSTSTWRRIEIDGVEQTGAGASSPIVNVFGVVTTLALSNIEGEMGSSSPAVLLNGSAASITRLLMRGVVLTNGSGFVKAATAGQTLGTVWISDSYATGASFLADLVGATTLHLSNVQCDSPGNGSLNLRATANATVLGDGASKVSGNLSTTAGYALRVNNPSFPCDISKITSKSNGDMATNTAAASGVLPGAGPVVTDGTTWRLLTAGAVKTGTATLSAGTVTVADTAVTANSIIRLSRKTIGGTVGALYISALTASTSFAVTSTNASDTSVVYYEIVQY